MKENSRDTWIRLTELIVWIRNIYSISLVYAVLRHIFWRHRSRQSAVIRCVQYKSVPVVYCVPVKFEFQHNFTSLKY